MVLLPEMAALSEVVPGAARQSLQVVKSDLSVT